MAAEKHMQSVVSAGYGSIVPPIQWAAIIFILFLLQNFPMDLATNTVPCSVLIALGIACKD